MFTALNSYKELKEELLASSKAFYAAESEHLVANTNTQDYLTHSQSRIDQERERSSWIFTSDEERVTNDSIVKEQMIKAHTATLLEGEFCLDLGWFQNAKTEPILSISPRSSITACSSSDHVTNPILSPFPRRPFALALACRIRQLHPHKR